MLAVTCPVMAPLPPLGVGDMAEVGEATGVCVSVVVAVGDGPDVAVVMGVADPSGVEVGNVASHI